VVRLTYLGKIDGEPKIDDDHLEARWFSPPEIEKMDINILDGFFKTLLDKGIIKL
jgi:hypothetical protein